MSDRLKKHHRERLLRLADKLEGKGPYEKVGPVPQKKFSLEEWVNNRQPDDCGFVACAVGWACFDPWFRKRHFNDDCIDWHRVVEFFGTDDPPRAYYRQSTANAQHLFSSCSYRAENPRPATVAKRIREYVEKQS